MVADAVLPKPVSGLSLPGNRGKNREIIENYELAPRPTEKARSHRVLQKLSLQHNREKSSL
jgi:hypothetical protein